MKKIIFIIIITNLLSCAHYHIEMRQYGLHGWTPIKKENIIKIDTIYNQDGGVVKNIYYKSFDY